MTRALSDAAMKISSEFYDYKIFYTYEEYDQVELEPPWYDFDRKYVPNKVVVIVTVPPRSPGRTWKVWVHTQLFGPTF